jgi:large subunit ribosomal protein L15
MSSRNQRLAKRRGFTNIFKVQYDVINLAKLSRFESGSTVDAQALKDAGLISGKNEHVKILADGELNISIRVEGLRVSASARRKIEAAGGVVVEDSSSTVDSHAPVASSESPRVDLQPPASAAEAVTTGADAEEPEAVEQGPKPTTRKSKTEDRGPKPEALEVVAGGDEATVNDTDAATEVPKPRTRTRKPKAEPQEDTDATGSA